MLSPVLVPRLKDLSPDGLHVVTEWGATYPDDGVWAQARRLGLVIFTKDHDYGDPVRYPGPPPQVVRLRILNASTAEVEAYIREHAAEIEEFSESSERYLEV
jgi:predicted nuclease of predicted toxin-antitoxin system